MPNAVRPQADEAVSQGSVCSAGGDHVGSSPKAWSGRTPMRSRRPAASLARIV